MSRELPSIEELRESQRLGSVGKGTQSQEYCDMMDMFNQGTGETGDEAKPDSVEASV